MSLPNYPCKMLGFAWPSGPRNPSASVVLEVFVDFTCPFSEKIFTSLTNNIKPLYGDKLDIVFQFVPQAWHPQSCTVHETFLAVEAVVPEKAGKFLGTLLSKEFQPKTFDVNTLHMTRGDVHNMCLDVAGLSDAERAKVLEYLTLDTSDGKLNFGNYATRVLKLYIRQHRQLAVHVTPTCRLNGLIVDTQSGWTVDQWKNMLDPCFANPKI